MTENKEELLSCPFCGSINITVGCLPPGDRVYCLDCKITGPIRDTIEGAKIAWNTRATPKIVWPEKKPCLGNPMLGYSFPEADKGWNEALDEFARLNPWMKGASNDQ